jgi:hypothetical protein
MEIDMSSIANRQRREFLMASGQLLSGLLVGGSAMAAAAPDTPAAVKEPAVIGYPSKKG